MTDSIADASDSIVLAADIVAAFVANNSLPAAELPGLIQSVHAALSKIAGGPAAAAPVDAQKPAVSIGKSITPDYIVCLEDGRHFKSLKRHLTLLGITPDEYRAKWKLPADYPMVAARYAAQRSDLAKQMGLGQIGAGGGRKRGRPAKVVEAAPEEEPAS